MLLVLLGGETIFADSVLEDRIDNVLAREQQHINQREIERSRPDIFVSPILLKRSTVKKKGNCFQLGEVVAEGAASLKFGVDKYISNNLTGKCVSAVELNNALTDLSNMYIEKGYVTSRAYVLPQNIKKEKLIWLSLKEKIVY